MADSIYDKLRNHQSSEEIPWHELREELNRMAGVMIEYFNLKVEEFVIGISRLRVNKLGQYRREYNDLGLRAEILISELHIRNCVEAGDEWRIFGTLLHELDHAWQELHGKPGRPPYHNRQFQMKAAEQGLIINDKGHTQYDPGSPFFDLLEREGIEFPPVPEPKIFDSKKPGKSTLAKWICNCDLPQLARVGKQEFLAVCPRCNTLFYRVN